MGGQWHFPSSARRAPTHPPTDAHPPRLVRPHRRRARRADRRRRSAAAFDGPLGAGRRAARRALRPDAGRGLPGTRHERLGVFGDRRRGGRRRDRAGGRAGARAAAVRARARGRRGAAAGVAAARRRARVPVPVRRERDAAARAAGAHRLARRPVRLRRRRGRRGRPHLRVLRLRVPLRRVRARQHRREPAGRLGRPRRGRRDDVPPRGPAAAPAGARRVGPARVHALDGLVHGAAPLRRGHTVSSRRRSTRSRRTARWTAPRLSRSC